MHGFTIHAMLMWRARVNICYCKKKKKIDVSFSCVRPATDHEFCHNIVKVHVAMDPQGNSQVDLQLNNRADARKTETNLLTHLTRQFSLLVLWTVLTVYNAWCFPCAVQTSSLLLMLPVWEYRSSSRTYKTFSRLWYYKPPSFISNIFYPVN